MKMKLIIIQQNLIRNELDIIINYTHKINQEQEVRVHSMSLPSALHVSAGENFPGGDSGGPPGLADQP